MSPQFRIVALKTAQDSQKQKGEAQEAVQTSENLIIENNIDVTA